MPFIQKAHIPPRRKVVVIDMEDTLADISGSAAACGQTVGEFMDRDDFIDRLRVMPGAVEACEELNSEYDLHVLVAPSEVNPVCKEEYDWVNEHFRGKFRHLLVMEKRDGADFRDICDLYVHGNRVMGESSNQRGMIEYGSKSAPDWDSICYCLRPKQY